jgi:SMC interacting uncharacterized protein involved in chromosome segregation
MDSRQVNGIKKKLKDDYNFIKNDGNILNNISINLLLENDNNYEKTIEFIDTLSKKDIQNRMQKIINDLETAGEISTLIKETIKKDNTKLDNLKKSIEELENQYNKLGDNKTKLEKSIKDLQNNLQRTENEIASKIKSKQEKQDNQMSLLQNEITEKEIELTVIKNTMDSIFQNTYENEFDYEECDYIKKEPIIHLDVDKALQKIYGITKDDLVLSYEYEYSPAINAGYHGICSLKKTLVQLNFPINYILFKDEYIIKVYLINHNDINVGVEYQTYNKHKKSYSFMYLSNYGRFICSEKIFFNDRRVEWTYCMGGSNHRTFSIIKNGIDIINNGNYEIVSETIENFDSTPNNYNYCKARYIWPNQNITPPLSILPKLTYRMPRIFLDVIDAFHTQNNDMMQECCKTYLSITRTKGTEKEIIDSIELNKIIKEKDTLITEKDNLIKEKDTLIEEKNNEIEKMKLEIAKLKSALLVFTN